MMYNMNMNIKEEYAKLKASQEHVSNQDFVTQKAFNIFTEEEISQIYDEINAADIENTMLQDFVGHRAWGIRFSKNIELAIIKAAQAVLGDEITLKGDYSFARYSPSYGFNCKLFPHFDTKPSQRITFDIQLNSNEEWGIIVEDETFHLNKNEALIFAGTQQIHWRENKKVKPDAEIDMIFCHLEYKVPRKLDEHQKDILEDRSQFFIDAYNFTRFAEPY